MVWRSFDRDTTRVWEEIIGKRIYRPAWRPNASLSVKSAVQKFTWTRCKYNVLELVNVNNMNVNLGETGASCHTE